MGNTLNELKLSEECFNNHNERCSSNNTIYNSETLNVCTNCLCKYFLQSVCKWISCESLTLTVPILPYFNITSDEATAAKACNVYIREGCFLIRGQKCCGGCKFVITASETLYVIFVTFSDLIYNSGVQRYMRNEIGNLYSHTIFTTYL